MTKTEESLWRNIVATQSRFCLFDTDVRFLRQIHFHLRLYQKDQGCVFFVMYSSQEFSMILSDAVIYSIPHSIKLTVETWKWMDLSLLQMLLFTTNNNLQIDQLCPISVALWEILMEAFIRTSFSFGSRKANSNETKASITKPASVTVFVEFFLQLEQNSPKMVSAGFHSSKQVLFQRCSNSLDCQSSSREVIK